MKTSILALAFGALVSGTAAAATTQAEVNETLRNTPAIYNGLFTAALIKHVTDTCPAVAPPGRITRVNYFLGLYNQARRLGFSRAQIEAFVEDKTERARMRGVVESHLRRAGVDPKNEAAVCDYARAEIAQGTPLGRQLRER